MSEKFRKLLKKNPNDIRDGLSDILDDDSLAKIQSAINQNVNALFQLGMNHFTFAQTIAGSDWRHKISRYYYATYNIARSVRLHYSGVYTTDSQDHKDIGKLPDDFPNQAKYSNSLQVLRSDRNMSDYDHVASEDDIKLMCYFWHFGFCAFSYFLQELALIFKLTRRVPR